MRKIILAAAATAALLPLTNIHADTYTFLNGIQFGGQFGYAYQHYDRKWLLKHSGFTSASGIENKDYAGRLFIGYSWNNYIALQGGYLFLKKVSFRHINGSTGDSIRQTVGDITAKLSLPLKYFGLYIKPGIAYVHREEMELSTTVRIRSENHVAPVLGGGIDAYLTENFTINTEYDHYVRAGDFKAIDYAGLGLTYQFA